MARKGQAHPSIHPHIHTSGNTPAIHIILAYLLGVNRQERVVSVVVFSKKKKKKKLTTILHLIAAFRLSTILCQKWFCRGWHPIIQLDVELYGWSRVSFQ
jgi:hypothetical protein